MKKKVTSPILVFLCLFSCSVFSQSKLEVGSVASVYDAVANQNTRSTAACSFKTSAGAIVDIDIENYYAENGQLAMNGTAKTAKNSVFILKGTRTSLYGYIVNHDTKKAYEYTTVNGVVVVTEVPITKLCPDLYEEEDFRILPQSQNGPMAIQALGYSPMAQRQLPHIGKYNNEDILKLESRPGSRKVFFLDLSAVMNGSTPKHVSKEEMFINWQCAADQYSMYDVNITTNRAVYTAAGVPNSGIAGFLDEDGRSNADLNSFGTAKASRLYRDVTSGTYGYGLGRTTAHEAGHQFGLNHDGGGGSTDGYFQGIAAFQWCPTMGNYWYGNNWNEALYQWSKGEYSGANNSEDDLTLIKRHVPFLTDDIPTTKALNLGSDGAVSPKDNWGIINSNTDVDVFTFEVSRAGHITLKIDPIEFIRMLDVDAKITNASGTAVAQSNLPVNRSASFDVDLPAGSYKLEIKGGAEGTPAKGFSNYSSLGYYAMEGKITGASSGIIKTPLDNSISIYPNPALEATYLNIPAEAKVSRISLVSILGQTVFESIDRVNSIDVSALTKGVYLLKIEADGETIIKKITKL